MLDFTKEQVTGLLQAMGYHVPDQDLTEITHRYNALVEVLQGLDRLNVGKAEPWPPQPGRRNNNGR
jgi:hypothetical protein